MRGKANQSKFMKLVRAPITILSKARDLYMKRLFDCASKHGLSGANAVCPAPLVPRNPSVGSTNEVVHGEEVRELVRVVSKRDVAGTRVEILKVDGLKEEGKPTVGAIGVGRSYSVGIGRIGRIDEDKPCEFEEEEGHHVQANGNIRNQQLYPRSKTYVVK
ncbi:hypothetical protein Acr_06g0014450 [Actinidia rufa]|uniref:Uncharacterized protein n=1 Tax=Actinidia rufa TaxID=165716 RepID=A0A7J0ESQ5_9ERIC|nr:hypothetical protein Acr_06g0014450 [Actinidia rufa]